MLTRLGAALLVAASFWVQVARIAANYAVIEEIMANVQHIRGAQVSGE